MSSPDSSTVAVAGQTAEEPPFPEMVWIPPATYQMGSKDHYPEERPVHHEAVEGFWIDKYPVTNERFARFVQATGHTTFAEMPPDPAQYPGALPQMLYAGSLVFVRPGGPVDRLNIGNWWTYMKGAQWRHPQGMGSSIEHHERHPVVHVAFSDAEALRSGKARRYRQRRNGSWRLGEDSTLRHAPGGTRFSSMDATWRIPGRATSPARTSRKTGSRAHRPWTRFRLMAMACTT